MIHYHGASSQADTERLVAKLKQHNAETLAFQADLSEPEAIFRLFQETEKAFGRADIAVNIVGHMLKKTDFGDNRGGI